LSQASTSGEALASMALEVAIGLRGGTKTVVPPTTGGGGAPVPAWPAGGGAVDIDRAPFELMGARGALPVDKCPLLLA